MELLDVVDEDNQLTGKVMSRDEIHKQRLRHREVAVWIMNEKGEVLIQKRAATKKNNPNMLGMTAGHLEIGEDPTLGMLREMKEEIGVDASEEELQFLTILRDNDITNICFLYIYFYETNKKEEEYLLQKEEVSSVKYVTLEELKRISYDTNLAIFSKWDAVPMMLQKLEERKRRIL